MSLGSNLSAYKNVDYISAESPEALRRMLRSIQVPFTVKSFYYDGARHVAWIIPDRPLTKKEKQRFKSIAEKFKEV